MPDAPGDADVRSPRAYPRPSSRGCASTICSAERTAWSIQVRVPEPLAEPNPNPSSRVFMTTAFQPAGAAGADRARGLPASRGIRARLRRDREESAREAKAILTRARGRPSHTRPPSRRESEEIVRRFLHACVTGDSRMMAMLHADAERSPMAAAGGRGDASRARRGSHHQVRARLCRQAALVGVGFKQLVTINGAPVVAPTDRRRRHHHSTSSRAAFARSISSATPTSCAGSSSARIEHCGGCIATVFQ